jgi:hypothetical protein
LSGQNPKRIDLCPARYEEGAIGAKRIEGVGKSAVPLPYRGQGALIEREIGTGIVQTERLRIVSLRIRDQILSYGR